MLPFRSRLRRASAGRVTRTVVGRALRLVLAIVAGLAGSLLLGTLLRQFLFEVPNGDPATLVAVALLLITTSLAACIVPAVRASRLDPMTVLRAEN